MDDLKQLIIIAELDGCKVCEYEPYTWTTNIPWDEHPGEFLKCSGYRCKSCGDYHIGNEPYDGYCGCGINPLWLVNRPNWDWVQPKLPKNSNYFTSRNAIISVIMKVCNDPDKQREFIKCLWQTFHHPPRFEWAAAYAVIESTPRQLCEALIRSVSKWVDDRKMPPTENKNIKKCSCCGQLRPTPTEPGEWEYSRTINFETPKWIRVTVTLPESNDRDGQEGLRLWENGEMIWWPDNVAWRKL